MDGRLLCGHAVTSAALCHMNIGTACWDRDTYMKVEYITKSLASTTV